nr:zinc finger protein CONSTANS-LIKE 4 [Ipomoea batatas]
MSTAASIFEGLNSKKSMPALRSGNQTKIQKVWNTNTTETTRFAFSTSACSTREVAFSKPRNHLIRKNGRISHGLPLLAPEKGHRSRQGGKDSCKRALATVFCHADTAFLYVTCDSKIHTADPSASRPRRASPARSTPPPSASPATATTTLSVVPFHDFAADAKSHGSAI